MKIRTLTFDHFRNYSKQSFTFEEGTTLIVGSNGAGKTNILEACYLLATGKSFRAQRVEEMISYGQELAHVGCELSEESEKNASTVLRVTLTRGELQGKRVSKRRYLVDGVGKRLRNFAGILTVVAFRPEDLQLILGSPSIRRDFLDGVLTQVDREYLRSLSSYEKALSRRNKLLDAIRDEGVPRTQLAFWDQLLIKHGTVLTGMREGFLEAVNRFQSDIDFFEVHYEPSLISEKRLAKYAQEEIAAGYTLVGPHKDDISITHRNSGDGKELVSYGSRGEQRLAVLWIKLAELAFVTASAGKQPVLLLDDIFSELDRKHRKMVFDVIPHQQTLLTTTEFEDLKTMDGFAVLEIS